VAAPRQVSPGAWGSDVDDEAEQAGLVEVQLLQLRVAGVVPPDVLGCVGEGRGGWVGGELGVMVRVGSG